MKEYPFMARTTWQQKLDRPYSMQVKPAPKNIAGMKIGQIMLIPTARMVDEWIRTIPHGQIRTVSQMRTEMAQTHNAEVCCPITTGIFIRIVAEAAYESYEKGADIADITPVWRLLDANSPTCRKLTFDPEVLLDLRSQEGLPRENPC